MLEWALTTLADKVIGYVFDQSTEKIHSQFERDPVKEAFFRSLQKTVDHSGITFAMCYLSFCIVFARASFAFPGIRKLSLWNYECAASSLLLTPKMVSVGCSFTNSALVSQSSRAFC
jgi:hypothetical protein